MQNSGYPSQFDHEDSGCNPPLMHHGNFSPRSKGYSPRPTNSSPRHHGPSPRLPFSPSRNQSQSWKHQQTNNFTPLPNSSYNNQNNNEMHRHNNSHYHHNKSLSHNRGPYQRNKRNDTDSIEVYFSPCMLTDPWSKLLEEKNKINGTRPSTINPS